MAVGVVGIVVRAFERQPVPIPLLPGHTWVEMTPPPQQALAFLDELVGTDEVLRRAKPRISWIEANGTRWPYVTRRVCCFNYLGTNGQYCGSQCPIVPAAERAADALHNTTAQHGS